MRTMTQRTVGGWGGVLVTCLNVIENMNFDSILVGIQTQTYQVIILTQRALFPRQLENFWYHFAEKIYQFLPKR